MRDEDEGVEIPHDRLPPETLRRLIEEFVSREGTDYGHGDYDLAGKVRQVMGQLERGEAAVAFDPRMQSATIVSKR